MAFPRLSSYADHDEEGTEYEAPERAGRRPDPAAELSLCYMRLSIYV